MNKQQKPAWQKQICRERIEILFAEAEKIFRENPERAKSYIKVAHKIALRYRVQLGSTFKRKFCKKCFSYLKAGATSTVRLSQKSGPKLIIHCNSCGAICRIPYKKKG